MDWTILITKAYWPLLVVLILFIFRKHIKSLTFKNNSIGEILVELNRDTKIVEKKAAKKLHELDTIDVWGLNDIDKNSHKSINITTLNPVQKHGYNKLIDLGFVKKEEEKIILTKTGKEVVELAKEIHI